MKTGRNRTALFIIAALVAAATVCCALFVSAADGADLTGEALAHYTFDGAADAGLTEYGNSFTYDSAAGTVELGPQSYYTADINVTGLDAMTVAMRLAFGDSTDAAWIFEVTSEMPEGGHKNLNEHYVGALRNADEGNLLAERYNNNDWIRPKTVKQYIAPEVWTNIVIVYDANGGVTLYRDNEKVDYVPQPDGFDLTLSECVGNDPVFSIGMAHWRDTGEFAEGMKIDEFAVYGRALGENEIEGALLAKSTVYEGVDGMFNGLPAKVTEDGGLLINKANFPDMVFRDHVKTLDPNGDMVLTEAEAGEITNIDVSFKEVGSLSGIGYFTELSYLSSFSNELTELDLSNNKKLQTLYCSGNKLTSLDITGLTELQMIRIEDNYLTTLKSDSDSYDLIFDAESALQKPEMTAHLIEGEDGKYRIDMSNIVGADNVSDIAMVGGGVMEDNYAVFEEPVGVLLYAYKMNNYFNLPVLMKTDGDFLQKMPEKDDRYAPVYDMIYSDFETLGNIFDGHLGYTEFDSEKGAAGSDAVFEYLGDKKPGRTFEVAVCEYGSYLYLSVTPISDVELAGMERFLSFEGFEGLEYYNYVSNTGFRMVDAYIMTYNDQQYRIESERSLPGGGAFDTYYFEHTAVNYVVYKNEKGEPDRIVVQGIKNKVVWDENGHYHSWRNEDGKIDPTYVVGAYELTYKWNDAKDSVNEFGSWALYSWKEIEDFTVDENGLYFPPLEAPDVDATVIVPGSDDGLVELVAEEIGKTDEKYNDVAETVGKKYEEFVPITLSLLSGGEEVQPSGTVTVSIAVPEGWKIDDTGVIHVGADGKIEVMKTKASEDGKYLTFETDHFSVYALVKLSTEKEDPGTDPGTDPGKDPGKDPGSSVTPPQTGDEGGAAIFAAMLVFSMIGLGAVASRAKRERD